MGSLTILIAALLIAFSFPLTVLAADFECAFLQEKYPTGKSNQASCSMFPEIVYSTRSFTPSKSAHCRVEEVYGYEDYSDVLVDLKARTVTWTWSYGLTEDAKKAQREYYLKEGKTPEEATKGAEIKIDTPRRFKILSYQLLKTPIYLDNVTGKILDPPRLVPEHHLIIADDRGGDSYTLYIPEASNHAILTQYHSIANASWVQVRFGMCRKM